MAVSRRRCKLPLILPSSSRLVWCRHWRACRLALSSFYPHLCVVKPDPCHRFQLLAAKTFLSSVLGGDNRRGFSEFPFVYGVFGPSVACFVIVAFPSAVSKMSSWWCRLTLFLQAFSGSCSRWSGGIGVLRGYEFQGDHRELATPKATWEFPASMATQRMSRYYGHRVR
ncbi:hypothetical protein DY000_02061250 [Brassica cretica]|uniref:Uncharacterized protein n=1 Tax=Brassica cretica TaxID=69181 RepID=A0ABQ7AP49_BRACR|nr:hypothetical protein DY000_02061250 [Brassica cretica]